MELAALFSVMWQQFIFYYKRVAIYTRGRGGGGAISHFFVDSVNIDVKIVTVSNFTSDNFLQ